jgi:hypothetical protein
VEKLKPGEKDEWLEWAIEDEFVKEIEDAGWITIKGDKIKRGFSDRFLFGPRATTIIVEFKRTGAKKKRRGEKLQNHYRKQFVGLGFTALKVKGWNAAAELLDELLERYGHGN